MKVLEHVKEQIAKKFYSEALQLLEKLNTEYPNNPDVFFHLGKCYFYLGNYKKAEEIFNKLNDSYELGQNIKESLKFFLIAVYQKLKQESLALEMLLTIDLKENVRNSFDFFTIIDDLRLQIQDKCLNFNKNSDYDKTIFYIEQCKSKIDCAKIIEDLADFITADMQHNNFICEYIKTIKLYDKYNKFFSDNVFISNKMLNEYELATHKVKLNSKPRIIMLILTNICDLNCIMCYQNKEQTKNINKKLVNIVIDNLQYLEKIVWQGGEILILPYFKNILLKTLQFPRINQVITSNFQNINNDIIELIAKNNIVLTVSIDGAKKETYEKIRIGASFDKLENNIKKLNEYIIKYNSRTVLQINFLIMKNNYKEIKDIVEFAYKYKFSIVVFLRCVTDNENIRITKEDEKDVQFYIEQAIEKAEEYNIKIINVFSEFNDVICLEENSNNKQITDNKGLFCHLPWYEMTIQENNAIKPHCTCGYASITNIDKYDNIYDVWNDQVMQKYRKKILQNDGNKCIDKCRLMSLDARKKFNR